MQSLVLAAPFSCCIDERTVQLVVRIGSSRRSGRLTVFFISFLNVIIWRTIPKSLTSTTTSGQTTQCSSCNELRIRPGSSTPVGLGFSHVLLISNTSEKYAKSLGGLADSNAEQLVVHGCVATTLTLTHDTESRPAKRHR